jgi:hypothetical protein
VFAVFVQHGADDGGGLTLEIGQRRYFLDVGVAGAGCVEAADVGDPPDAFRDQKIKQLTLGLRRRVAHQAGIRLLTRSRRDTRGAAVFAALSRGRPGIGIRGWCERRSWGGLLQFTNQAPTLHAWHVLGSAARRRGTALSLAGQPTPRVVQCCVRVAHAGGVIG